TPPARPATRILDALTRPRRTPPPAAPAATARLKRRLAAASSDHERIVALLATCPRSAWRTVALNQARQLYDDLRAASAGVDDGGPATVEIDIARDNIERGAAAANSVSRQARSWLTGADVDTAWGALHAAEERLILIEPVAAVRRRLPGISTSLRNNLQQDDPRLKLYCDRLDVLERASDATVDRARQQIRAYLHDTYAAFQAAHANVRATRNTLMQISFGTLVLIAVICLAHALNPSFINLGGTAGDATEPWSVVLLGAMGGVIGALATVWRLAGSSADARLPNAQAFVRIPIGGAIALAGVMLLQSGFISPLKTQTSLALLTFAFVAGYTPDLLLRYLDGSLKS
ncbi:MAG TPA: hypothetical protein VFR49_06735, partial [Solirubrobacteraceae bacterium]|nr:hypothetical protein [Solirubrobacteraceae bacterium]